MPRLYEFTPAFLSHLNVQREGLGNWLTANKITAAGMSAPNLPRVGLIFTIPDGITPHPGLDLCEPGFWLDMKRQLMRYTADTFGAGQVRDLLPTGLNEVVDPPFDRMGVIVTDAWDFDADKPRPTVDTPDATFLRELVP